MKVRLLWVLVFALAAITVLVFSESASWQSVVALMAESPTC